MSNALQYAVLILVAVSAVMAVASYFATRREVDSLATRLGRVEDQPGQAVERFVLKEECAKHHLDLEGRLSWLNNQRVTDAKDAAGSRKGIYVELGSVRKEMVEMERRLNSADEERTNGLHARLNDILIEVSEMRGAMPAKQPKA